MKKSALFTGLFLLTLMFFTTCHNSIMQPWWEDGRPPLVNPSRIYTVSFQAYDGNPAPGEQRVMSGARVGRVPPMTRDNYAFGGWYTDAALTREWNFATDTVSGDMTLYARWEHTSTASFFRVTFLAPGAIPEEIRTVTKDILAGTLITEPTPPRLDPIGRQGFIGWYIQGTNTLWNFATMRVNSPLTLEARWGEPCYTVDFESNLGSPIPRAQDLVINSRITEPFVMYREGYVFGGWFSDAALTREWDFASDTIRGDLILYAKWVINTFTITFDADGGIPAPSRQTVAQGALVTRPPVMRKTGQGFLGWYADAGRNQLYNFDTPVNSDLTLYALWGNADITVNFDLKLPSGSFGGFPPTSQIIANNGIITEPLSPANISGWSFNGWWYYTGTGIFNPALEAHRNALVQWDFNQTVSINDAVQDPPGVYTFTLYARWVPDIPDMVWVRGGNFRMGAEGSGTSPVRNITLNGFYISKYEITQTEYRTVIETFITSNSGYFGSNTEISIHPSQRHDLAPNLPVERVSWFDAVLFCNAKSIQEAGTNPVYDISVISTRLIPGNPANQYSINEATVDLPDWNIIGFRLPTEAEWEYAARGGIGTPGNYLYSGSNIPSEVAWFGGADGNAGGLTHPVGTRAANGLGIHDMSGNVMEWCWDWYAPYSGQTANLDNPRGPSASSLSTPARIRRGGSWGNIANNILNVARGNASPSDANYVNGFRIVRNVNPFAMW